jgi:ANTAR domain/PAS fold
LKSQSGVKSGANAVSVGDRVGSFKYLRDQERWEWSDAVAQMHGYMPGSIEPTTALVMSHKHPDDAPMVALLIEAVAGQGQPFSSRHRIIDTTGLTHNVLVVGETLCAGDGTVTGSQGFYVDLSDLGSDDAVQAVIADFTTHRAEIEQAKGVLMAIYDISAERAFDILVWRSQETNTKLRKLVRQIIRDFTEGLNVPSRVRERADHLLLTAHERVSSPQEPPADPRSDAC